MNRTNVLDRELYTEDITRGEYKSKIPLEHLESRIEQGLKEIAEGKTPYIPIQRKENVVGYTDFENVYVVQDLPLAGIVNIYTHERIHKETGLDGENEDEVDALTYKILENLSNNKYVDPEVRQLARMGFEYDVENDDYFVKSAPFGDRKIAYQQEGGGQRREAVDELLPYAWKPVIGALDMIARIPLTLVRNLLSLGAPMNHKRDVTDETFITREGKNFDAIGINTARNRRQDRREREAHDRRMEDRTQRLRLGINRQIAMPLYTQEYNAAYAQYQADIAAGVPQEQAEENLINRRSRAYNMFFGEQ